MKNKIILLVVVFCTLFITGCDNQNKYKEIMKDYANQFYIAYQKNQEGLTNPTVSIKQLKSAVKLGGENYDLSKLKKCTDESYVELILDEATKDIKDIKYYLECK